jgi:beta-galactosidase
VCYYPEHWPEKLWDDDLVRMLDCGIDVVRVAEFAWCLFEPREGEFDFSLFDRFLACAARHGVKVIFGTPTATPPAWLTEKYPEVLNAQVDGTKYRHGLRRHYSYNSPKYRELTARIVTRLAEHYGNHPQIIGWQIDNELNCETDEFHSEADHEAFRAYLLGKYGTLENLNEKMGGVVWSQSYSDWSQVHLRRPTIGGQFNPHMLLEEKRFFSKSAVDYCALQAEILKKHIGNRFVTTNGIFKNLDYTSLVGSSLDFLTYDSYPNFVNAVDAGSNVHPLLKERMLGMRLDETRALSPAFGIMEQQSGANGWTGRMEAPMPRPGQMRLWTLQSVAHGADFVSYFRWRTAPVGTEIYWHGLNDYDNRPNRRIEELKEIRRDFERLAGVAGAKCLSKIALAREYHNDWDGSHDRWVGRPTAVSSSGWYAACQKLHAPCDYAFLTPETTPESLARYSLVVYPHAAILTERTANLLRAYAENGGVVLFGARTGYKDEYGRCPMRPMPGYAAELTGARVTDYTFIGPDDEPGMALWHGETLECPVFNDILEPCAEGAVVEATFACNYYAGEPALISRSVGKGRAYYFGGAFSEATAQAFLRHFGLDEACADALSLPPECELAVRVKDGTKYLFALNYTKSVQTVYPRQPLAELLTGKVVSGGMDLPPYGVAVFRT